MSWHSGNHSRTVWSHHRLNRWISIGRNRAKSSHIPKVESWLGSADPFSHLKCLSFCVMGIISLIADIALLHCTRQETTQLCQSRSTFERPVCSGKRTVGSLPPMEGPTQYCRSAAFSRKSAVTRKLTLWEKVVFFAVGLADLLSQLARHRNQSNLYFACAVILIIPR